MFDKLKVVTDCRADSWHASSHVLPKLAATLAFAPLFERQRHDTDIQIVKLLNFLIEIPVDELCPNSSRLELPGSPGARLRSCREATC